jgi:hypothetical protein
MTAALVQIFYLFFVRAFALTSIRIYMSSRTWQLAAALFSFHPSPPQHGSSIVPPVPARSLSLPLTSPPCHRTREVIDCEWEAQVSHVIDDIYRDDIGVTTARILPAVLRLMWL